MARLSHRITLSNPDWQRLSGIVSFTQSGPRVFAGGRAASGLAGLELTDGTLALDGQWGINGRGSDFRLSDLITFDDRHLLAAESGPGAHLESLAFDANGQLTGSQPLALTGASPGDISVIAGVNMGATTGGGPYLASAGGSGLTLWNWTGAASASHSASLADSAKLALAGVSDMAVARLNGADHLLTASASADAICLVRVNADGSLTATDMLDADRGLWVSGPGHLATVAAQGVTYGVVAAANSSSLSLVRLLDSGAMRISDHVNDDLSTRFAQVDALTTFSAEGRGFVVAGGMDDGLTLFEILPDGRLMAHDSVENLPGMGLSDISALTASAAPGKMHILAASATSPGVVQMEMDVATLAPAQIGGDGADLLIGDARDDLLFGGAGADTLSGGAGDDLIYGGAGADRLSGGAGADTFVFDADSGRDIVTDFTLGEDRLDLGRWGRIYDVSALNVAPSSSGAVLSYGSYSVTLQAGQRLTADDLGSGSLVFSGNGYLQPEAGGPRGADSGALVTGLGGAQGFGEQALARSDDGSVRIDASALFAGGLDYFGNHYSGADLYVNTNGSLSFGRAFTAAPDGSPDGAAPLGDVIAPFWADIDTRIDGEGPESGQIWVDQDVATQTLTLTWDNVGSYGYAAGLTNSFQLQLAAQGGGDFDITYRYGRIDWDETSAPDDAGATASLAGLRLPDALGPDGAALSLDSGIGNSGQVGVWSYEMRDGSTGGAALASGLSVIGTAAGDVLTGGAAGDILRGLDGPDVLRGNDGTDWLYGGDGGDTLNGGDGDDFIFGGSSAADLRDVIYGGAGDDVIDAGHGNDLVYGGTGNDVIAGGYGVDELIGQDGDDVITGSAWSDLIFGGAGDDFLNGGFGFDRLNGGSGADKFYHLGIRDHGADWIQDYNAAEGDVLFYGGGAGPASPDDFLVQRAETENAGAAGVAEVFVTHAPTGVLMWALVDGEAQDEITLQIGNDLYDLLS